MVEPPVMSAEEAAAALGRMESSIKGKSARMNELLGLTSSQRACVAAEDAEGLLALVEQKGRAMAEIDGMDLEFLGCFQSLKGYLGVSSLEGMTAEALEAKGLDAAVMRGVKAHVASTANAIKELQAMDSELREGSETLLGRLRAEVKKSNQKNQVRKAYTQYGGATGAQILDRRG